MRKMKKLLVLLTLMVAVFGFTAGAFAAFGDPICVSCKGALRNVPLYTAATQTTAACLGFDYDLNSAVDGYCSYTALNKYKAIFAVCNCDIAQASKLVPGFRVAVRMEILVNGLSGARGAYWSGTGVPAAITFENYITATAACAGVTQSKSFGAPIFYKADGTTSVAAAALSVDTTCTVPASAQSTILTTPFGAASGYVLTLADVNLSYWWIDIPPIRIDPAVAKAGDIISVKIQIFDATQTPICPSCIIPLCGCTIDVAQVGCTTSTTSSLRFPYFTSLTATDFWNGIAIGNATTTLGSCTLIAYEKGGTTTGTATVAVPAKGLFVDLLENMTFTGTRTGGVPVYIDATCNYGGSFGFGMMVNDTVAGSGASMGYIVP
jgi:hypothetical protein